MATSIFHEWSGFSPRLLVCSYGHDHGAPDQEVVGLDAERHSLGRERRPTFHCPSCGILGSGMIRSDLRHYPNIGLATDAGSLLPCGICFRELSGFVSDYLLRSREQR
jgi:hypothetical protein